MKKLFLFLLCTVSSISFSQTNINADCINAIPLCSTPNFTFNATSGVGTVTDIPSGNNISNPTTNPASSNSGCLLAGELKPQWLLITVGNAGNLEFIFGAANSANPQVGFYDWAMWPYTPTTCAGILNNTLPPIRCNWNASSTGGTGIASSANQPSGSSAGNFEPPLAVLPCQQYIICISNYSGVNTLVSFQSIGSASLSCNPNCLSVNHPALCSGGSSSIIASSSGLISGITYSLNPGGASSSNPTFVISPTVSTAYTVYATGVNTSSITVTQTAVSNVTVNPSPLVAPTITQSTCTNTLSAFNLGLNFVPTPSATPAYTINWSAVPAGVTSATQTSASGAILPGVYTASILTAGGCQTVTSFTIDPKPAAATVSLVPAGPYTITCTQPTINLSAVEPSFNYTWTNGQSAYVTGQQAAITNTTLGNWTVTAINPVSGCVTTKVFAVGISTNAPSSVITPTIQNINCSLTTIATITAVITPTVNVSHYIYSPLGATYSATGYSTIYSPGPGVYTHCAVNDANGCSTCKQFTVASSPGFPTFSVVSPQNYTLGCGTKSVATINIINVVTSPTLGQSVEYAAIPPGGSSVVPTGSFTGVGTFTIAIPGTWTLVAKDLSNFCQTRIPISILDNKFGPDLESVIIPSNVLTCAMPSVQLQAVSPTPNTSYNWLFPQTPGQLPSSSITINVNSVTPTATLIANYTLSLRDDNNTCITQSVIPMYQNIFPPKAVITNGNTGSISCKTPTVVLTNGSSSNIPPNSIFPITMPVIGYVWEGPSPQVKQEISTTYVAATVGDYTLTAMDLNNGCTSKTVVTVSENRIYPTVSKPADKVLDCGNDTTGISPVISGSSNGLTFNWVVPTGAFVSDLKKNPLYTNKTGIYRVLVTNTVNGCAKTVEAKVINGSLAGNFSPDSDFGYAPHPVSFINESSSTTGNSGINTYWSFGNGTFSVTNSASLVPLVTYTNAGTYTVTAFVRKGLCLDTVTKLVRVEFPSSLQLPNVFTPNGDNVNDVYFLKATGLSEINFKVFDRWGHLVYYAETGNGNVSWDGKKDNGKELPEGVYFFVLKARGLDGKAFEEKGHITLIR